VKRKAEDVESDNSILRSRTADLERKIDNLQDKIEGRFGLESKVDDLETQISRLKDRPSYR
jgi:chaperonin cofactor prefoldin